MTAGKRNGIGAAASSWVGPYKIGDYLARVVSDRACRPPDAPGVYLVSEQAWHGLPNQGANLVYADQAPYLRYRIGQLMCDLLGFTSDDPAQGEAYEHRGGHFLWHHYCLQQGTEPLNLYFAWCAQCQCIDCAINALLELTPMAAELARRQSCNKHVPPLELAYNCSVMLPSLRFQSRNSSHS
ncbi:MAG TPA: hypothetical protein VKV28_04415 [Candidatus Binataceae bacterium]|nr:hypothetical protein [Candidatus Binataceae bacterium]